MKHQLGVCRNAKAVCDEATVRATHASYAFFTICTTSSSSRTWSLPTFCGWCLHDVPQTHALPSHSVSRRHTLPRAQTRSATYYLKLSMSVLWMRLQKSSTVGFTACRIIGAL